MDRSEGFEKGGSRHEIWSFNEFFIHILGTTTVGRISSSQRKREYGVRLVCSISASDAIAILARVTDHSDTLGPNCIIEVDTKARVGRSWNARVRFLKLTYLTY